MVEVAPLITLVLIGSIVVLASGLAMRYLRQPPIVAYILAGILFGSVISGFAEHLDTVSLLGELGVILLLFFIGMEISLPRLLANWRVAIIGTSLQISLTLLVMLLLGLGLGWPLGQMVLLGFVLSLSSTAVLLRLMEDRGELHRKRGMDVLSILLVQDVAIIPMLLIITFLGDEGVSLGTMTHQAVGTVIFVLIVIFLVKGRTFRIPMGERIQSDRELQVFAALLFCFGLAGLAALFRLPLAVGAFIGGMLVGKARNTHWIPATMHPFRVVFVGLLFVSIGMLIDVRFLWENIWVVVALVLAVLLTNTAINTVLFRALKESWKDALFTGAMLAQIGEFSFVLAAAGFAAGLVTTSGYQFAVMTIAITLLVSPLWIELFGRVLCLRNTVCDYQPDRGGGSGAAAIPGVQSKIKRKLRVGRGKKEGDLT